VPQASQPRATGRNPVGIRDLSPAFRGLLWRTLLVALFPLLLSSPATAQNTKTPARYKLYTTPDPAAPGGITGRVTRPGKPIEQVLAIPFDAPEKVYEGTIEGDDKRSFRFTGLPMRKYDLVIIFDNTFYEGIQLERGEDTLTDEDRKKIDAIVQKSEPFFTHKFIHRAEGTTGRGNQSRAICTFLRAKGSELMWEKHEGKWNREDFRRTFKLLILKDVGPGWQVVRARDLYPVWTSPTFAKPTHHFTASLSRIRVADSIKDLGDLDLTR
jgi:hypothetical protein